MAGLEDSRASAPDGVAATEDRFGAVARELTNVYIGQLLLTRHLGLKDALELLERHIILNVLEQTNGNQHDAAAVMGIKPTTLHYKLKRLGIQPVHRFEAPLASGFRWPR